MNINKRTGAKGALLDEYERAVSELQQCILGISEEQLTTIVDPETRDEHCRSVQTILSHVVRSGYVYARYVQNRKGGASIIVPELVFHTKIDNYIRDLNAAFKFTETVFQPIEDHELEEPDDLKKMKVGWGQTYDIEQLTEHAIVHILRHRRQIEKFKMLLEGIGPKQG